MKLTGQVLESAAFLGRDGFDIRGYVNHMSSKPTPADLARERDAFLSLAEPVLAAEDRKTYLRNLKPRR